MGLFGAIESTCRVGLAPPILSHGCKLGSFCTIGRPRRKSVPNPQSDNSAEGGCQLPGAVPAIGNPQSGDWLCFARLTLFLGKARHPAASRFFENLRRVSATRSFYHNNDASRCRLLTQKIQMSQNFSRQAGPTTGYWFLHRGSAPEPPGFSAFRQQHGSQSKTPRASWHDLLAGQDDATCPCYHAIGPKRKTRGVWGWDPQEHRKMSRRPMPSRAGTSKGPGGSRGKTRFSPLGYQRRLTPGHQLGTIDIGLAGSQAPCEE